MKRERRSDLNGTRFELLASLLSSWTDTRTEEERAKLHLCGKHFTPPGELAGRRRSRTPKRI